MAAGTVEDEGPVSPRSCVSDCESSVSGPVHVSSRFHMRPIKRLEEDNHEYIVLKHRLCSGLGPFSEHCHIVAAYKNTHSTNSAATRLEAFEFSSKCMTEMRGGDPNIKYAWYGTSRDGVGHIICNGFSSPENAGPFGQGLYLSPANHAVQGIATSTVDRHGIRHMLLCKVILGRSEQILLGSKQSSPSSIEFDSGVDDQMHPKCYIIWNEQVKKTHILPMYVISIKLEHPIKGQEANHIKEKPTSPWIPLGTLVSMLALCLPPNRVCLIKRFHNAYVERKLSRVQLIHHVRQLTGDRLLLLAIKAFQDKQMKAALISALKRDKKV